MLAFTIHGHFYQPPREDPLTGLIPEEQGAAPYPNWNEKIFAECYRPNAELGNFGHISFNIGPTLIDWIESRDPETYHQILEQDRINVSRYGAGNALAQAYNHTILPLASYRDKVTQVAWGIADFEHRFGRKPRGMWLPETAVDIETLRVLAEHQIEFTILAPWQADFAPLDTTQPYRVALPGGRSIIVFFYHSGLSGGISFAPELTADAYRFASSKLKPAFDPVKIQNQEPQLLVVASDGELYGHHQPFREKFLAHLLDGASGQSGIQHVFPALWLRDHRVRRSISIRENTSWSCSHGVKRWYEECGCAEDGRWKVRLRRAIDRLADELDRVYFQTVAAHIPDPWALRHAYGSVLTGERSAPDLIFEHAHRRLPVEAETRVSLLLRAQFERQRMYTSCGWFFEDFDRIEPKNNLAYAAQAVDLTRKGAGVDLSKKSLGNFKQVISPRTGLRADQVFGQHLRRSTRL